MRINSITINNFRCYYGSSTINFNDEGKLTLIYGDSGFGKSSFLQFFKWMLYDNYDFGKNDDMPLYNKTSFKEKKVGDFVEVSGVINFEHLGVKYNLIKKLKFKVGLTEKTTLVSERDFRLSILENDNWVPFNGDISNKINSIMPIGLSSYFLLDGERARDIVLDSKSLKVAIYSLFGIDAYEKAIAHLGSDFRKKTVIGHFNNLMTSQMTGKGSGSNISAAEMQEALEDLNETIEALKEERHQVMDEIELKNARRDEIFKILGESNSKNNLKQIINSNNQFIKECENRIRNIKHRIGDLFYQYYPYLFLSRIISSSSTILREKNMSFANNYKNIFENLKKDLLKEIISKNTCVCGRELDDESLKRINDIISVMPPDSYSYQFGQFVSKAKRQIQQANLAIVEYDKYLTMITQQEQKISRYEDDNHEKLEVLKRLDEAKKLVDELEQIKDELIVLNKKKSGLEGTIATKKQIYDMSTRELSILIKNNKISSEYIGKLNFFKTIKAELENEKLEREKLVKNVLNSCVKDVFKKLTTQKELNADEIQFINDNFSLRTTYLTGGQLAVDVYSYVIGIIKALQECKMDNNENPIIIDAPFAFTGNEQSEHIFETLPSVAKQVVLLTLDLNKIKKLLNKKDIYEFYVINNTSQEKAIIERGNIDDIKL